MKYLQTIEGYHSSNYEFNPGRASARRLDIGHKLRCYINKFSRTYEPRRDYFHLKFGSLSNEGRDCLYQDQVISEQMIIRQGSCKILCFIIPPLPDNCQVDEGQGTLRMKINLDYEQLQTDTAVWFIRNNLLIVSLMCDISNPRVSMQHAAWSEQWPAVTAWLDGTHSQ